MDSISKDDILATVFPSLVEETVYVDLDLDEDLEGLEDIYPSLT